MALRTRTPWARALLPATRSRASGQLGALLSSPVLGVRLMTALQVLQVLPRTTLGTGLKIPVWWRRAVLPSLPWVVCFLSFFLLGTGLARTGTNTGREEFFERILQKKSEGTGHGTGALALNRYTTYGSRLLSKRWQMADRWQFSERRFVLTYSGLDGSGGGRRRLVTDPEDSHFTELVIEKKMPRLTDLMRPVPPSSF